MFTTWSASRRRRRLGLFVVGILGLFLTVDSLLAYGFAVFSVLVGGPFNPYAGFVLMIVLPLGLAAGVLATGWAWYRLDAAAGNPEVPDEVAVQGR
jgi:hypothetical protein